MKSLKIFKNKALMRFAHKAGIGGALLCKAIEEAERGLIAADLGGGFKQRIARSGQGKSGGYRTLVVFRAGTRAFFVHGFAKSERDNIGKDELIALKKLGSELLAYNEKALNRVVASGTLTEVRCDEKAIQ